MKIMANETHNDGHQVKMGKGGEGVSCRREGGGEWEGCRGEGVAEGDVHLRVQRAWVKKKVAEGKRGGGGVERGKIVEGRGWQKEMYI